MVCKFALTMVYVWLVFDTVYVKNCKLLNAMMVKAECLGNGFKCNTLNLTGLDSQIEYC